MAQASDNTQSGASDVTTAAGHGAAPLSLPVHTRLGEFEILSVIGEGGFSIVYLAHDHQLQRTVAIKEYLPGASAHRNAEGLVLPRFEKYDGTFKTGLQSFLKESRILAQFEHHSLLRIHRFWEQNGTAYMVMQCCQGKTMRQVLQNDPTRGTDEVWLKQIMAPVLDALRLLHSRNCFHRDLSPDNIMILDSGAPMLLDFGAARQVIGDMTQALTVILKPGFAPIEQYADDESMQQGPWTDIYGVGAVLYFAVTGKAPTASVARLVKDPLKKLADLSPMPVSSGFAWMVDRALAVFPKDRPQSVDEFFQELIDRDALSDAPNEQQGMQIDPADASRGELTPSERAESAYVSEMGERHEKSIEHSKVQHAPSNQTAGPSVLRAPNSNTKTYTKKQHPPRKGYRRSLVTVVCVVAAAVFAYSAYAWFWRDAAPSSVVDLQSGIAKPVATSSLESGAVNYKSSEIPETTSSAEIIDGRVSSGDADVIPLTEQPRVGDIAPDKQKAEDQVGRRVTDAKPAVSPELGTGPKIGTGSKWSVDAKLDNSAKDADMTKSADVKPVIKPMGANVKFSLHPWGRVFIDGVDKGSSPPLIRVWLSEGEHTVVIENGEFEKHTELIRITDKKDVTVAHRFGP